MTGRPDDAGRTAAYAAEDAAFGGTDLDGARPLAELVEASDALTNGEWWRSSGAPVVAVTAARAGTASSSARSAGDATGPLVAVRVAADQSTIATLAHELAHALAGLHHGHDATFRAAHVDVCAVLAGRDPAARLAAAYRDLGVPAGRRAWSSPVRVTGDGFAVVP